MAKFVQVEECKLPLLQSIISERLPYSASLWNVLQCVQRELYSERVKTIFYTLDGAIHDSSLIVCLLRRQFPRISDLFVILSAPVKLPDLEPNVSTALESLIDWSVEVIFAGIEVELADKLKLTEMCGMNGVLDHTTICDTLYFPRDAAHALRHSIDDSTVRVRMLRPEEASTVVSKWKFAGLGSLERMEDSIETIGSGAVDIKEGENEFKLVSWILANHDGTVGALYTVEDYRGKGYAKLAVQKVSQHWLNRDCIPVAHVEPYNQMSRVMLEKIGYKFSHQNIWIVHRLEQEQLRYYTPID